MPDNFVVTNGSARIAVERRGVGPATVLLHPGVADRRCWSHVEEHLSKTRSVLSYDRRGFGSTTYDAEPHAAIDDLIAVLDGAGIDHADVLGNSMGGRLAVDLALAAPDRVDSLILVAASVDGAPPPTELPARVDRLDSEIDRLETLGDLDAVNELEAQLWLDGPTRKPGSIGGSVRELFLAMNGVALRSLPTGEVSERAGPPAWERLGELDMPALVLAGVHDLPHIRARMETAASMIRDSRFVALSGSAHLPQLDDPDAFAAIVEAFLDAVRHDVNGGSRVSATR